MLVIADNQFENSLNIAINEDQNGMTIKIPVIMIEKNDALRIKEDLDVSQDSSSEKKDKVTIEFWIAAGDKNSYKFIENFKKYFDEISNNIELVPYYALWYCAYCKYQNYQKENPSCVSGGRYCYPDSSDQDGEQTGKVYVVESLRQICLFKKNKDKWYEYVTQYNKKCISSTTLDKCSQSIMSSISKDLIENIDKCILESFSYDKNYDIADNKILAEQRKTFLQRNIQIWPTIYINKIAYGGSIQPKLVYEAICNGFKNPPKPCIEQFSIKKTKNVIIVDPLPERDQNFDNKTDTAMNIIIFLILFFVLFLIVFYICKKYTKSRIKEEIFTQVSEKMQNYFAMRDQITVTNEKNIQELHKS